MSENKFKINLFTYATENDELLEFAIGKGKFFF